MARKLIDRDKAFELYYALGTSRSLSILHDSMSRRRTDDVPTARTFKDWSRKDNWQDRVLLRDNAVREGVQEAATAVVVEAKIKELEQLDAAYSEIEAVKPLIVSALQSKQAAEIVPETTQDITSLYNALSRLYSVQVKIVEVARKIRGESDRHEIEVSSIEYVLTPSEDE